MNGIRKVVINTCYGGFSISNRAIKRLAEMQGKPCYFFHQKNFAGPYARISDEEALTSKSLMIWAFSTPIHRSNPMTGKRWKQMSDEERAEFNRRFNESYLTSRPEKRDDPDLIRVVEELGAAANGSHAELKIVEIPSDIEWSIGEYDGVEHVAENHRTWS